MVAETVARIDAFLGISNANSEPTTHRRANGRVAWRRAETTSEP